MVARTVLGQTIGLTMARRLRGYGVGATVGDAGGRDAYAYAYGSWVTTTALSVGRVAWADAYGVWRLFYRENFPIYYFFVTMFSRIRSCSHRVLGCSQARENITFQD